MLKIAEETSSSSNAEDEISTIVAEPMNATAPVVKPATRVSRPIKRGIVGNLSLKLKLNNKLKLRLQMKMKTLNTNARGRRS